MSKTCLAAAVFAITLSPGGNAQPSIRVEDLIGTWELVSVKDLKTGSVDEVEKHQRLWLQLTKSHWTYLWMDLDRKLITTAGRKAVVGRPILYRSTKEFLLRFGLKDVSELPSMEEFEKLVAESFQSDLLPVDDQTSDSTAADDAAPPDSSLSEGTEQEANLQPVEATDDDEMAAAEQHNRGENDPAA